MVDLDAKLAAYNKALGVPGKEEVANQKQTKVEEAQSHLDRSKDDYEKVSRILMDEFEAFKTLKATELRDIALAFVKVQVCYEKLSAAVMFDRLIIDIIREKYRQNQKERGKVCLKD